jgi:putative endonuclease
MTKRSPSNPAAPERRRAERRGGYGEILAMLYLVVRLYRIHRRRYKCPLGEIDLVASHFGTLVFVEVKTRRTGAAETEALMAVNRRRIAAAARHYLARHPALSARPIRFDVIFLAPGHWPRHVKGAFDGDGLS